MLSNDKPSNFDFFKMVEDEKIDEVEAAIRASESFTKLRRFSSDNYTALHIAAEQGDKKMCEMLVKNGASIEARNLELKTPIKCAIEKGQMEIVKYLEEYLELKNSMNPLLPFKENQFRPSSTTLNAAGERKIEAINFLEEQDSNQKIVKTK